MARPKLPIDILFYHYISLYAASVFHFHIFISLYPHSVTLFLTHFFLCLFSFGCFVFCIRCLFLHARFVWWLLSCFHYLRKWITMLIDIIFIGLNVCVRSFVFLSSNRIWTHWEKMCYTKGSRDQNGKRERVRRKNDWQRKVRHAVARFFFLLREQRYIQ